MRRILATSFALTIGLAATKYDGPIPLDPKPRFGKNPLSGSGLIGTRYGGQIPASVKSLRPVFKWKTQSADQKVDFIIWDAVKTAGRLQRSISIGGAAGTPEFIKGETVYYKEGIAGGEHQIEKDLNANTVYFWSIKVTGTTDWTGVQHSTSGLTHVVLGTAGSESSFFLMKTPKK
jgi:hypothetical protein